MNKDEEIALLKQERDLYRNAYKGNMTVLTSWMSAYHRVVTQLHTQESVDAHLNALTLKARTGDDAAALELLRALGGNDES